MVSLNAFMEYVEEMYTINSAIVIKGESAFDKASHLRCKGIAANTSGNPANRLRCFLIHFSESPGFAADDIATL